MMPVGPFPLRVFRDAFLSSQFSGGLGIPLGWGSESFCLGKTSTITESNVWFEPWILGCCCSALPLSPCAARAIPVPACRE